jgi:CRP/FNR family transcriptional regulator, cyclic AMP receptor protein
LRVSQNPGLPSTAPRSRPFSENPALARRAAELLRTPGAFLDLSAADAACAVGYMRLVDFVPGTTLFRAGDSAKVDYMLLVLEGEVSVEASTADPSGAIPISVLGPGSVLGEMGLLDGSPRSTTCTTISPVQAAGFSRRGLELLVEQHPAVGARLVVGLSRRIAERLRALGEQLQIYAQLAASLQAEVARLRGPLHP